MIVIYGLSTESEPNNIRYIGKTSNILDRLSRHLSEYSLKYDTYKNNWIKSELLNNNKIIINVLYELNSDENWQEVEISYIEKYKQLGFALTNSTIGGDGIIVTSDILLKRNNTKNINYINRCEKYIVDYNIKKDSDKYTGERICKSCHNVIIHTSIKLSKLIALINKSKNRNCLSCSLLNRGGWQQSDEAKNKISKSKKNLSQDTRDKLSKINKGKTISIETRKKVSKQIICIETGIVYYSISEASRDMNIGRSSISQLLSGKCKTAHGYTFKFLKNEN